LRRRIGQNDGVISGSLIVIKMHVAPACEAPERLAEIAAVDVLSRESRRSANERTL